MIFRVKALIIGLFCFACNLNAQTRMNTNQELGPKEQSIVVIAALTAKGDLAKLKPALNTGLEAGLTVSEIKEVLVHLYAYCGFPRSIRGLQTFMEVLDERRAKGINDKAGDDALPVREKGSKYERGKRILEELTKSPQPDTLTGYSAFSPAIDTFLKEHLFADIFERGILTYSQRELVTVSVLSSICGADPMLRSHLAICLNVGLTPGQLQQFADILKSTIGENEAKAAIAQTSLQNPFGLVYEDAITVNMPGKVNIHPVNYKLNGINIAANVYTPAGYDPSKKYPAVVIAHPNGGIKEQTAGLYAQRLAEAGYISITADAAYQGASGGEPRHTDKPLYRIEDIHGMADFITQYRGVDADKLALFGICGGGGYALKAAQSDKRFKAVATLSMFNTGEVRRNGFQNSQLNTIQERLKQATDARAQEAAGGSIIYAGVADITDEEIAKIPTDLYREGYVYYYRTHAHPNSTFIYTMSSLFDLMTWDAATNMDLVNQPLLMMAGSKADTKYMTAEAFSKAVNAKSKELFLIDGATHIQTYWKPEYVSQAVNKLVNFYKANL